MRVAEPRIRREKDGTPVVVSKHSGSIYAIALLPTGRLFDKSFDHSTATREGWCLMLSGWKGKYCIQRDDESNTFPDDHSACQFVRELADKGSAYHVDALMLIEQRNEKAK